MSNPLVTLTRLVLSTGGSEWGHIPLTSGHYYPVIMCRSAWLHLLFLVDSLMLEESNFTWWMIIRGRRGYISFMPCRWIMHKKIPYMPEQAIPTVSDILHVGLLQPGLLSACAWGLLITIAFTCPIKSSRLSVLTLPQRYEKLLANFQAPLLGRLIHRSHDIHDHRNQSALLLWSTIRLLAAIGITCQSGPPQSCHFKSNQYCFPTDRVHHPSPHTRLNISINIWLKAKHICRSNNKKQGRIKCFAIYTEVHDTFDATKTVGYIKMKWNSESTNNVFVMWRWFTFQKSYFLSKHVHDWSRITSAQQFKQSPLNYGSDPICRTETTFHV